MLRVFGICGLGIVFLLISAPLRGHVYGLLAAVVGMLARYSPFSYVIFAAVAFVAFMIFVSRGSRPR